MLRTTLHRLKNCQTRKPVRKPLTLRARLGIESLEDRKMMSASSTGFSLSNGLCTKPLPQIIACPSRASGELANWHGSNRRHRGQDEFGVSWQEGRVATN